MRFAWILVVACGASTVGSPYPTWEEAERMRASCGGALAAIMVENIQISERGTRSQRMQLEAQVLASSHPWVGARIETDQYVGGDAFMERSGRYRVGVCQMDDGFRVTGFEVLRGDPQEAVASAMDPVEPVDTEEEPTGCAALAGDSCNANPGCVYDAVIVACREVANECEAVRPYRSDELGYGHADFREADPCSRVAPQCAYHPAHQYCVPFEQVAACPDSLETARALTQSRQVFCQHPGQPALDCQYAGEWCACHRPTRGCGGARPPPGALNRPAVWRCLPDAHAGGCPSRPFEEGDRCEQAGAECVIGCTRVLKCRGGRWRYLRENPPQP